jgi:CheY-like chemotaxis protein
MEKIIIADNIKTLLYEEESFFNRSSMRIFPVTSNKEALEIHSAEKVDLIITNLDMPEMSGELLCSIVRNSEELRKVSIIIVYSNTELDMERISKCRANAFITIPINLSILFDKAQQLLNIPKREAFRAPISVKVHGKYENKPFLCRSENISASGMLFETDKTLSKGDIIICSFILPDSTHIIANAEIIRVVEKITDFDTNQYGIKFSNLAFEFKSAIGAFVEKKSTEK